MDAGRKSQEGCNLFLWQEILIQNAENAEEPERSFFLKAIDAIARNAELFDVLMLPECMAKIQAGLLANMVFSFLLSKESKGYMECWKDNFEIILTKLKIKKASQGICF